MPKSLLVSIFVIAFSLNAMPQTPGGIPNSQQTDESVRSKVDGLFSKWDKADSPGCALGVIKDRKLVYSRGYGMADLEHNAPITASTAFDIGSISKHFTAMAIMLLVQQGKLSLDDDVRKYIPEVPAFGPTITLRNLLYHTSGLRNHFLLYQLRGWRWGDLESMDDALSTVARQKELNFKPGELHSYSNTGYLLLGEVVKRVSGQSLRMFSEQHIFNPLGMNDTIIHDDVNLIVRNRAWGYSGRNGGWVNNITRSEEVGDSNVYTSIQDLAKWDQNFYEGKVGGETVIRQMLTPGTLEGGKPFTYSGASYAAGLRIGKYKGLPLIWHAGFSSSRSEYLRFPDQRFSVFCLCNTGEIDPSELARQVADIYLADLLRPEPGPTPPSPEEQAKGAAEVNAYIKEHAVSVTADKLARLAGLYVNPDNGNVRRLPLKDGKLMFERRPGVVNELAAVGDDRFVMSGVPAKLEFSFNEPWPGTRLLSLSSGEGTPLVLVYVGPDSPIPADKTEFVGTFQSGEADATVTTEVRGGKLVLRTKGFEEPHPGADPNSIRGWFPLEAISADSFRNNWIGILRFSRNSQGQITGFAISNFAGGVRHLLFSRIRT